MITARIDGWSGRLENLVHIAPTSTGVIVTIMPPLSVALTMPEKPREDTRMSGGSYEYAYDIVERFADALEAGRTFEGRESEDAQCQNRLAFAMHLRKVAEAMKAIEWEDSYDSSQPTAENAIKKVLTCP